MTREEAIKLLKEFAPRVKPFYEPFRTEYAQAIDLAIESLSADEEEENGTFVNRDNCNFNRNDSNRTLVEVVRCKDCIYWQSGDMGTGEFYEPYCEMLDTETDESAFCSDGKRREP